MINSDFRKKMADSWFSYLQSQICKEFEIFEKGKKKNEMIPLEYIKKRGVKPFEYHIDLEIDNELTPDTWKNKEI